MTGVGWIDAICTIIGGVMIGLILAGFAMIFVWSIVISISDRIRERRNRKNGNLHFKVDTAWKDKTK